MTDIFTGSLTAFSGPSLVIEYPPEAATGGDIDLDFTHIARGHHVLIRIQAKRLNAAKKGIIAPQVRSYEHLLHKVADPTTKKIEYQFRTLTKKSSNFLSLYMFYNHGKVIRDSYYAGTTPVVAGVNLAFADDIAKDMESKLAGVAKSYHNKRLMNLRKYFFELKDIFCIKNDDPRDDVPTPDAILGRLLAIKRKMRPQGQIVSDADIEKDLMIWREKWAIEAHRLSDGPAIRCNEQIESPKITFLSGRTDDDRTPKISHPCPNNLKSR